MKTFTIDSFLNYLDTLLPKALEYVGKILIALIAYYICSRLIKWAVKVFRTFLEKRDIETAAVRFMASIINAGLYFILIATIATGFGLKESSVVAILGSIGVGIGLALQGGLSNLAGGIIIVVLRPFVLGDYIVQQSQGNEGTVKHIDMFYTTLLTVDNRKVVIPNAQLTNNSLINVTAQDKRKLEVKVGISYESDIRLAKKILEDLLYEDQTIMSEEEHVVFVDQLAESSVIIGFRAWVSTNEYWSTKWRMNEQIKLSFDEAGISIPYNQLDVHIVKDS